MKARADCLRRKQLETGNVFHKREGTPSEWATPVLRPKLDKFERIYLNHRLVFSHII